MRPTFPEITPLRLPILILPLTALVLLACPPAVEPPVDPTLPLPAGAEQAAREVTPERLAAVVRFLADDLLEGRGPGSRGDDLTQRYLSSQMKGLGLEPGGPDGSWYQPFEMVGITSRAPSTWTFSGGGQRVRLDRSDDFMAFSGVQAERSRVRDAEIVFVGYGIEAPEYDWDDFKGADLEGKVLLMMNNDPDWDPDIFGGETRLYYGRWTYKYESAGRQGAAGAIIIHTTPSAGYPWQVVRTSWDGEQFELADTGEPRIEVAAWTTEDATRQILALTGHDLDELKAQARSRDFEPLPLGIRTSIEFRNDLRTVKSANVAGLLRGSDPELRDQVVVYTAHHDHLGTGEPDETGDPIFNGARDNASGVAQILAIARAFTALPEPPRRSVLFLPVGAEEQGLLGSRYYAENPTFPAGRIAAALNFDSANIWGKTRDVTVIGIGKTDLDPIIEAAAARQGRTVVGDQFPDRGYFYRSDQFSFARGGVPAAYFDIGTDFVDRPEGWGHEQIDRWTGENYHQQSDRYDPETWNLEGAAQDAQLGFVVGLAVAQRDELPAWVPGDEFEAARLEALAELEGR